MITIPGYHITEQVYTSETSYVYRGYREEDGLPLYFKVLRDDHPSFALLAQYRREYELTQLINSDRVIKVHGLLRHQHNLVILVEDFGGESLALALQKQAFSLADVLTLALKITHSLNDIHRHNIVHKDINPSNIVWNAQKGDLKIIDFGTSMLLARENLAVKNPDVLEGTLPYISPEQTGRMNRSIDYRTDYYSLGVTLYELLTGTLPFKFSDAMAMVHAHIADVPVPPSQVNPTVPAVVSDIVMKLMSKTAEARYQSLLSLEADLEECARQLQATGRIEPFPIAQNDISDRFQIPETLYGRQDEIAGLLRRFDHVAMGNTAVVLYTGEPGIGKSALVKELHKPIVEQGGYFIAGKYDQLKRNIPYSAIIQAFGQLIQQILTESEARLNEWRREILQGIGSNGQILIDLFPALELIIGPQPAVLSVPANEAQNRFQYVFQNFVRVIAPQAHPLVLFIDDLQWADSASINLLKLLTIDANNAYFLLIGAYRDNEVDETHPLILTIEQMRQAHVIVDTIHLDHLSFEDVHALIVDTLHRNRAEVRSLATLVYEKTSGNAFFVTQFLKSLYQDGLLTFDGERRTWEWDLRLIRARSATENVIELLSQKIRRFPSATQQVLSLASCIGNVFDLGTLALINKSTPSETFPYLWSAIVEDLVVPLDDSYRLISTMIEDDQAGQYSQFKFLHDRVQQAAYELIPADQRKKVHLDIGRLLYLSTPDEALDEALFDILNHLNEGVDLIDDPRERLRLANLNLQAGEKAKLSTAYETALRYLTRGMNLLPSDSWEAAYELTFGLYLARAECATLTGSYDVATHTFNMLLTRARTPLDKATILNLMVILNTSRGNVAGTLDSGKRGLAALDFHLPQNADEKGAEVGQTLGDIQAHLAGREIEDLLALSPVSDPAMNTIMELCLNLIPMAAMSGDLDLYALLALRMVNMSMKHGSTAPSSHAFIIYGVILINAMKDYKTAYRFGQLGLALGERFNDPSIEAKNNMVFACWINHWSRHLRTNLDYLLKGYQKGLEAGDFFFAASNLLNYAVTKIHLGQNVEDTYDTTANALAFATKSKDQITTSVLQFYTQLVSTLRGRSLNPSRLDSESFDTESLLTGIRESNNWIHLSHCLICKLEALYLYGDIGQALETARELEVVRQSLASTFFHARFQIFYALTLAVGYAEMTAEDKAQTLEKLTNYHQEMALWAEHCPENFSLMVALIGAEIARIQGDDLRAMPLYDAAIEAAQQNDYRQYEAMANEAAARFYLARGQTKIAALYMREAHYVYSVWGAVRKVQHLEETYPQWFNKNDERRGAIPTTSTHTLGSTTLDFAAILKASQAIASEINFDQLIARLIHIAVENVGAESGHLILYHQGQLTVEAFGAADQQDNALPQALPLEQAQNLSAAIVHYVARTRESVILGDASQDSRFVGDPYIQAHAPKSVLCTPIVRGGQLIGVLYLENNLVTDAFTSQQLEVLNLLNVQMAASIENARLYRNLQAQSELTEGVILHLQSEVSERMRAEEKYRSIFENSIEGIFQMLPDGDVIMANPACARILGYDTPEELVGAIDRLDSTLYVKPIQQEQLLKRLRQGQAVSGFETQLYRRDGTAIWVAIHAQPVYGKQGEIVHFEGLLDDITERVETQEALRQEEERFRYVAMATRDGIYDWDILTDTTVRNEAYQALYSPNEPVDSNPLWWEENIHPEDRRRVIQGMRDAFKDGRPTWLDEYRFRRADGGYASIIDHAYILYDDMGDPVRMIGAVTDVTQHRQMEQALEEERNLLRTLIDHLPHYIYYKDTAARLVMQNEAAMRTFGVYSTREGGSQEEIEEYHDPLYHNDDIQVLQTGQPIIDREETAVDIHGNPMWVLTSKIPIYDKDRQVSGLVGISIDITERKHTEQALRDSEESMRQLADGAFEGIVIHEQGTILEVNQAFCRLYGYERADVIGKSMLDLTAPESREVVRQKIATNNTQFYEAMMLRKDGTPFRVEAEGRLITYRGRIARIATIHDLTERELAESRRLELALANQKTSILKEFLNVVSHDLKTPLSIITVSLYLLDKITDPEGQKAKMEQIKTQVRRLERLIQDILTVSRLDTVPETIFNPVNLNQALSDIHEQFQTVAEEKRITFKLDLESTLPQVYASDLELYRALTNLVENALHYTPAQGTVTVRTFSEEASVVIEVCDTGIGIGEADLAHVFEHFYRADKARATDTGGTGLGLAIVKKIVDLHGGTIEIESKLGEGSTFRVRLPLGERGEG